MANRTSDLPSKTDKLVAENNCLQTNRGINPITEVHFKSFPPITMQLMEEPHQNTVLNPAAPNFQPNQVASESNVIAALLQFPQPVNSQYDLVSKGLSINQNCHNPVSCVTTVLFLDLNFNRTFKPHNPWGLNFHNPWPNVH